MLNFWKRKPNRADTLKLVRNFVRLVITVDDTPTLIRRIAEQKQFMLYCSVAKKADKNTDPEHFRLYRDLEQESHRQGFAFGKLKEKLTTIAGALGLDVQTTQSVNADYYQILGVSENADIGTIKKAFRAKARQTHPDTTSGENDRFLLVLEAYKVLTGPSVRNSSLSKQQKAHGQWSEVSKDHQKGKTLKKTTFRKYGVHFLLIVMLLVVTALIADFVMQQGALVDGAHRVVTARKPSSENQNSHQDVEYKDEEQLIFNEKKHLNKSEIPKNESLLVLQNPKSQNEKEILDEIYIEENQTSRQPFEYKDEERLIAIEDKPINKNVADNKSLKIIQKKHEKKLDVQNFHRLKIGKTDHENSRLEKLSDSKPLDLENNHKTDHYGSSILAKAPDLPFPDLRTTKKNNDKVSDSSDSKTMLPDKTLQINKELEKFLFRYCEAYETRDLTKLMRFFKENAIENGVPFLQLLPTYQKNFQNLASIHYRINIVNYTVDPDFSRIRVNGQFFLRWQKIREKQWHQYNGKIHFDLISNDDSFLIRELTYRFTD
jgi:curved DNA-binding protein CbpA